MMSYADVGTETFRGGTFNKNLLQQQASFSQMKMFFLRPSNVSFFKLDSIRNRAVNLYLKRKCCVICESKMSAVAVVRGKPKHSG